jgi:hypothetical protein
MNMATRDELVKDFLAQKRIAVAGVSRTKQDAANLIYQKLRGAGYEVYAINPNADTVEGDQCYPDLKSTPQPADALVVVNKPEVVEKLVREADAAGIRRVWMHRSPMGNSVSKEAVQYCQEHNMAVIAGGCPMMFCPPVDFGHKCMRWFMGAFGALPK